MARAELTALEAAIAAEQDEAKKGTLIKQQAAVQARLDVIAGVKGVATACTASSTVNCSRWLRGAANCWTR